MNTEATTLYKLMVLYMLSKVNFPLSNNQISDFMLNGEYTSYFTLQEVLNSLVCDNFIQEHNYQNSTQYRLTSEGKETISFFQNKVSSAIRDDIDNYLKKNNYDFKCDVGIITDYYKSTTGDYVAKCSIKEGNTTLIDLEVAVPLEEQAESMCYKWKESSQDIYDYIIQKLL